MVTTMSLTTVNKLFTEQFLQLVEVGVLGFRRQFLDRFKGRELDFPQTVLIGNRLVHFGQHGEQGRGGLHHVLDLASGRRPARGDVVAQLLDEIHLGVDLQHQIIEHIRGSGSVFPGYKLGGVSYQQLPEPVQMLLGQVFAEFFELVEDLAKRNCVRHR